MTRFIVRRILVSLPVLFGVLFAVFALARVIPGNPCTAALGERTSPARCADFNARHGLDKSIPEQFAVYLGELAQGDLGTSTKFGRPVGQILIERLPVTVELTLLALVFAIVIGVPLGVLSAARRNSPIDVGTMVLANLGVSVPIFVLGLLLAYVFAITFKDSPIALPPSGRLTPGMIVEPLADVWGLESLSGPPRAILDFLSGIYIFNGLLTTNWTLLGDALRHLILPTSRSAPSRWRSSPGSPAPASSTCSARTSSGLPAPRASAIGGSSCGTGSATPCCPSSRSSGCSSAACCREPS